MHLYSLVSFKVEWPKYKVRFAKGLDKLTDVKEGPNKTNKEINKRAKQKLKYFAPMANTENGHALLWKGLCFYYHHQ